MKNTFYLLFIVVLVYSCKAIPNGFHPVNGTIPVSNNNSGCDKVYSDIKKKWAVNDSLPRCYFYNEKLMKEIEENKQCFIGKDTTEIKKLFGKCSYQRSQPLVYFYSLPKICRNSITDVYFSDYRLYFDYSENGNVRKIEIDKIATNICH